MLPILIQWGGFALPAWHTFYVLGAMATFALLLGLAKRYAPQIERQDLARLYVLAYVSGYLGARLLSILVEEPEVQDLGGVLAALARFGPMTFYGGAIGAFLAGSFYILIKRLPFALLFDFGLPAGLLGLAIGRIGCFLNGDDYGKAVGLAPGQEAPFWAVTFPNLQDGIQRYPVQLLEAGLVGGLVLALCLAIPRLQQARPGLAGYLAIIGYANLRFGLEFLRDDFRGFAFGTWLSTSQFISLLVLALCALSLPLWLRQLPALRQHRIVPNSDAQTQ